MSASDMNTGSSIGSTARAELSRLLHRRIATVAAESPLAQCLPIQTEGTLSPLICVIGGGAGVPSYRRLASLLAARPVYALQLSHTHPETLQLRRIEDMAAALVDALRRDLRTRRYYLCGHSLGATLAFEMAQQLSAAGDTVCSVFLIDQTGPDTKLSWLDWWYWQWVSIKHLSWRMRLSYLQEGLRFRLRTHGWLPSKWRAFLFSPRPNRKRLTDRSQRRATVEFRRQITDNSIHALRAYHPAEARFPLTLLRARSGAPRIHADPMGGWGRVAQMGIQVHALAGTHMQLFQEPCLHQMAAILSRTMENQAAAPTSCLPDRGPT